jgi:hypothetical protein
MAIYILATSPAHPDTLSGVVAEYNERINFVMAKLTLHFAPPLGLLSYMTKSRFP